MIKILSVMTIITGLCFSTFASALEIAFEKSSVLAQMSWEKGPIVGKESILNLYFTDSEKKSIELLIPPKVSLWMPDMGHGSGPTSIQRVLDENGNILTGVYRVRSMYFVMPGFWDVKISIKNKLGFFEEQIVKVEI